MRSDDISRMRMEMARGGRRDTQAKFPAFSNSGTAWVMRSDEISLMRMKIEGLRRDRSLWSRLSFGVLFG
jgi:hypothetical protein